MTGLPPRRNSMNGGTAAVDIALEEWGEWMHNANKVLGWRTSSLMAKIKKERDGASQASAPTEIPEGVVVTDAAVAKLGDIRQKVIKAAYLYYPHKSKDVQRRSLKMSLCRWDALIGEARRFVALQLNIPIEKKKPLV